METLLVVDDSAEIRKQMKWGLGKEYSVLLAQDSEEAIALFRKHRPAVVTLDLGLPPDPDGVSGGFACLDAIMADRQETKVIVITGNDQRENALKAVDMGAYDFYQKPVNLAELKVIISRAFHLSRLEEENRQLQREVASFGIGSDSMLGQCSGMQDVFAKIRKIATSDISVLIVGESGTGKELVARAIHDRSGRKERPFVAINCGAIPDTLLESELFGYEKGAFTGANIQTPGKFEFAHHGTLFLDEIAELPAQLQVKLLRFLQEKTIQRVGGREDIPVDARIVCATNRDIATEIREKRFREDLYYRIGVVVIELPPLRERGEDIALLAKAFLKRFSDGFGKKIKGFTADGLAALRGYPWPGNVRELENKIQRAVIMAESASLGPDDLSLDSGSIPGGDPEPVTLKDARDLAEQRVIRHVMTIHNGNISKTAEELGISRPTLYDLMKKHQISTPDAR